MQRRMQPMTAEEQLQAEIQMEMDVIRCQKQEKKLAREREAFISGVKLVKQQKLIGILKKENNNTLTDLYVATSKTKKKADAEIISTLTSLLDKNGNFNGRIKEKQGGLKEIDYQIDVVKKQVLLARSKICGDAQFEEKVLCSQKVLEALENKLEVAATRFCTIQTENNDLRSEIEHLLIERINFNLLWEKLIENLNKGKKFMMDLIEQASVSYNQRDEWCTKLQALRTMAHGDFIVHTQEMIRLQHHVDDHQMVESFLIAKGQKRIMRSLEEKEMAKRLQQQETMKSYLTECKTRLAEIMEFTGIDSVNGFYKEYIKREEHNVSLLDLIVAIHHEMENITEELATVHDAIDRQRSGTDGRVQRQMDNLEKLGKELKQVMQKTHNAQVELNRTNHLLNEMYLGIDKLFRICKCSKAPFLQLLGDNATINKTSVLLFLSVLEERISELILSQYYNQKTAEKKSTALRLIKEDMVPDCINQIINIIPTNPCPLCVEQELASDVIDTLQFVQTKEEVKAKLDQRMSLPGGLERLHNVSACHLPKSRQIIQRRYQ